MGVSGFLTYLSIWQTSQVWYQLCGSPLDFFYFQLVTLEPWTPDHISIFQMMTYHYGESPGECRLVDAAEYCSNKSKHSRCFVHRFGCMHIEFQITVNGDTKVLFLCPLTDLGLLGIVDIPHGNLSYGRVGVTCKYLYSTRDIIRQVITLPCGMLLRIPAQ